MEYVELNKKVENLERKYKAEGIVRNRDGNFFRRSYTGIIPRNISGTDNFNVIKKIVNNGAPTIVLSAPHSVAQYRRDNIKGADVYTGSIVEMLCELISNELGMNVIGITRKFYAKDDPNYNTGERSKKYRDEVVKQINNNNAILFIDVHGYVPRGNYGNIDIMIGTDNGNSEQTDDENHSDIYARRQIIKGAFKDYNIEYNNPYFTASNNNTVSKYAHNHIEHKIPCYQFELSDKIRKNAKERTLFLYLFLKFIYLYNEDYKKNTNNNRHLR